MELWKVELRENVKTTVAVTEAAAVAIVGDLRAVCRRRCIEVEVEEEEEEEEDRPVQSCKLPAVFSRISNN